MVNLKKLILYITDYNHFTDKNAIHYNQNLKYSKTCLKRPLKKDQTAVFKTDYHLMQVKSIAECPFIKLPSVIKTLILSIFEWPLKTGFTVTQASL